MVRDGMSSDRVFNKGIYMYFYVYQGIGLIKC